MAASSDTPLGKQNKTNLARKVYRTYNVGYFTIMAIHNCTSSFDLRTNKTG